MTKFRLFGRQTDEVSERELSHRQLAREVAAEGMVLLKNEGVLPLQNKKIALFGAGARMTVKGGTGSGNMQERYSVSIEEGLKNAGFTLASTRWMDRFDAAFAAEKEAWRLSIEARIKGYKPWEVQRMFDEVIHVTPLRFPIGDEIQQEDLPEDTDTAIYVIARQAGESADRRLEKGDYYLADVEEANIRTLAEHYEKVLLVINCGGILDLSILDEVPGIGAVLHFAQGGEEGGNAFADIVSGKATPSGKLTDTWAIDYYDYPCAEEFGILGDVLQQNYREGIYVGYRWFDANKIEPRWPFGFGLSYADFEITVQNTQIVGTMVTVTACVRNISSCYSGKDVVQLYLAKPEGKLHKEHKALAAFRKTGLLAPGQEEICTLQIDLQECASYDEETACKLLEQGEYGVFIGSDSRKNALCAVLTLEKTVVTEKLTNILPISKEFELFVPQTKALVYPAEVQHLTIQMGAFAKKGIHYDAPIPVIKTKQTGEYLKTLSDKELIELCVGAGFNGLGYNVTPTTVGRTSINLLKKGIPNVNFSDGPAGLNLCPKNAYTKFGVPNYVDELPQDWQWGWIRKIEPFVLAKPGKGYRVYQYMTCFPAATLQAQTWNPSLIEEVGHAIGTEMIEAGVTLWLAPGLNIHRNPLCGRNFEYYSEDPCHISSQRFLLVGNLVKIHALGFFDLEDQQQDADESKGHNSGHIAEANPLEQQYRENRNHAANAAAYHGDQIHGTQYGATVIGGSRFCNHHANIVQGNPPAAQIQAVENTHQIGRRSLPCGNIEADEAAHSQSTANADDGLSAQLVAYEACANDQCGIQEGIDQQCFVDGFGGHAKVRHNGFGEAGDGGAAQCECGTDHGKPKQLLVLEQMTQRMEHAGFVLLNLCLLRFLLFPGQFFHFGVTQFIGGLQIRDPLIQEGFGLPGNHQREDGNSDGDQSRQEIHTSPQRCVGAHDGTSQHGDQNDA